MADKDNSNGTATTIGGMTSSGRATSRTVEIDNRLRFENGRIYISSIPYEGGRQSDFPEKLDVTEQVAKAIAEYIKPNERPRYIIRVNQDYLQRMFIVRRAETDEQRNNLFFEMMDGIRSFVVGEGSDFISASKFIGADGKEHDSWTIEEVEEGDIALAVVEDISGNVLYRVDLKEQSVKSV